MATDCLTLAHPENAWTSWLKNCLSFLAHIQFSLINRTKISGSAVVYEGDRFELSSQKKSQERPRCVVAGGICHELR